MKDCWWDIKNQIKQTKPLNHVIMFLFSKAGVELFDGLQEFCRLLPILTNSLDPDQDQQNVSPDLDLNCLKLW